MFASVPPARQTSILPERIISIPRPMASEPEAQAVEIVQEGPFMPKYILTFAEASLFNERGAVSGGSLFTPALGSKYFL